MLYPTDRSCQELVQVIFGIIVGYMICNYLYNNEGECPTIAPTIPMIGMVNGRQNIGPLRIHHWIWGTILLVIAMIHDMYILSGICFAFICNGLSYEDCFEIYKHRDMK